MPTLLLELGCEELPAFRATWPDAYVVPSPT